MKLNLKIDEPVIAIMGPEANIGWGPCQFPEIRKIPDGRLVIRYHLGQDVAEEYGKENGWLISEDNGDSWHEALESEIRELKVFFGTKLPNGKHLRIITPPNHPVDKDFIRSCPNRARAGASWILPVEDIPKDLFPMGWQYGSYDPVTDEDETFFCDLDFPGMTIRLLDSGALVRPFPYDNLCVAPDGTLWQATYYWGRNPENLGNTSPYFACYFFNSLDNGRSFKLKSWIQYLPDTNEFPEAFGCEGFCEPYLSFLPDGSMVTLLRTGIHTPSYIAHSYDGGNTWTRPEKFDRIGVFPQILTLDCGVTLASYGRPGVFVRATDDPHGKEWDTPIEILPYIDRTRWTWGCDSCSYTGLVALDERTAMLAYSDFSVSDEEGKKRKCLMVRKIHAE